MGTNYYLHRNVCSHCKRSDEPLHIGKSSWGWCFALRVYPDDNIRDIDDWWKIFETGTIRDEYGDDVTADELKQVICVRAGKDASFDARDWHGYHDEEDFHRLNCSERGPVGLLRARVDGRRCIGHGIGTWDLMVGEFS